MVYLLGSLLWFPCCISRKASPLHLAVLFLCSPCFPYAFDMLLMHQSPIHLPCFCYAAMLLAIHFLCSYALPDSAIHLPCSHAFARLCQSFAMLLPDFSQSFAMLLRCICDVSVTLPLCFCDAFVLPSMNLPSCLPCFCDASYESAELPNAFQLPVMLYYSHVWAPIGITLLSGIISHIRQKCIAAMKRLSKHFQQLLGHY